MPEASDHYGAAGASPARLREAGGGTWQEYLNRIAAGDAAALAALYDESSLLLYSIVSRIVGDLADAEEITLDVYAYVWHNAASYQPSRGSVAAWLVMLARSRSLDRVRGRATRLRVESPITTANPVAAPPASEHSRAESVRGALQRLPAEQRQALELAYFEGFSQAEMAELLKLPLGTVKTRVRLGLARLRDLLKELDSY